MNCAALLTISAATLLTCVSQAQAAITIKACGSFLRSAGSSGAGHEDRFARAVAAVQREHFPAVRLPPGEEPLRSQTALNAQFAHQRLDPSDWTPLSDWPASSLEPGDFIYGFVDQRIVSGRVASVDGDAVHLTGPYVDRRVNRSELALVERFAAEPHDPTEAEVMRAVAVLSFLRPRTDRSRAPERFPGLNGPWRMVHRSGQALIAQGPMQLAYLAGARVALETSSGEILGGRVVESTHVEGARYQLVVQPPFGAEPLVVTTSNEEIAYAYRYDPRLFYDRRW